MHKCTIVHMKKYTDEDHFCQVGFLNKFNFI